MTVFGPSSIFEIMWKDSWTTNDSTPRFIENPEWTKKKLESDIANKKRLIELYQSYLLSAETDLKKMEEQLKNM